MLISWCLFVYVVVVCLFACGQNAGIWVTQVGTSFHPVHGTSILLVSLSQMGKWSWQRIECFYFRQQEFPPSAPIVLQRRSLWISDCEIWWSLWNNLNSLQATHRYFARASMTRKAVLAPTRDLDYCLDNCNNILDNEKIKGTFFSDFSEFPKSGFRACCNLLTF